MKPHTLLAFGLAAVLAVPALAAAPGPGRNPELQKARLQFMAAEVVQKLGLTAEQKQKLKGLVEQARALRDKNQKDPAVLKAQGRLKDLLGKATKEVHDTGAVTPQTQQDLMAVQGELGGIRQAHRAQMQPLFEQMFQVLTPEQRQILHHGRGFGRGMGPGMGKGRGMGPGAGMGMGPGAGMGPGMGMGPGAGMGPGMGMGHGPHGAGMGQGWGGHGRGMMAARLVLSDEFLAELSR